MKRKIAYATLTVVAIATAFLIGKMQPSKYTYLDLNHVTSVTETNGIVTINANGDCYTFEIDTQKGE